MRRRILPLASSVLAIAAAGPALADLTAEDVWNSWLTSAEAQGQTVTVGSSSRDAETLTQTDVTISMALPEGRFDMSLPEVVFTEEFGGSVAIGLPDSYAVAAAFEDDEGQEVSFVLDIAHPGLSMTASGDPGAVGYAYSGATATIALAEFMTDGTAQDVSFTATLDGFSGQSTVEAGALNTTDSTFAAGGLTAAGNGRIPGDDDMGTEGGTFAFDFALQDIASESRSILPPDPAEFMAALDAGAAIDFTITYGASTLDFSSDMDGQAVETTQESDRGSFAMAMDADAMRFDAESEGSAVRIAGMGPMMPPISYTVGSNAFGFSMPMTPSDEGQPFSLLIKLEELAVDEGLWSMFDPAGALSRDPANLVIDLAGAGRWFVNVFDPESMAEMESAPEIPGEVQSLQINELRVELAGAEAVATGDFDIDNSQMPPVPVGSAELDVAGLNALIDALIAIGLLPEEQAMGARMFMGMFAVPGDGPDTLKSVIEATADGAILVNGQRVR